MARFPSFRRKKKQAPPKPKNDYGITDPDGELIDIPAEGSLPLLAIGYRGLMAWRAKRKEVMQNKKKSHG